MYIDKIYVAYLKNFGSYGTLGGYTHYIIALN